MSDIPQLTDGQSVDVVIIGGGVAGSSLATVLASSGLEVVLVERDPEFRDRIRGESIHPWGVRELNGLGLRAAIADEAGGIELPFWTRFRDAAPAERFAWSDIVPGSPGVMSVRHPIMQSALLNAARDAGAHVFRPATAGPWREGSQLGVSINYGAGEIEVRCRLIVGADGKRSAIRGWIGGTAQQDPVHHAIGGAIITGIDLPQDSAYQAYFPGGGGFAMIYPQTGGTSRIYYVCPVDEAAELQRAEEPASIVERVQKALPDGTIGAWESQGPAGFFPNANIKVDRIHAPGVLLIGDAAGANDPTQGHGLSLVFRDVREVRDLLNATSDWRGVPAQFARTRQTYFEVLRQHAHWSEPLLTDVGPEAEALQARIARARELDPSAGGFAPIFATGPDGLIADDAARRHFLGEDLPDA